MKLSVLQKSMRGIALLSCALATMSSQAQEVTTIECETPAEYKFAEIDERSGCSGQSAINFHAWKGGYASYVFTAPQAGTYDLTFYYVTCDVRWFSVKVNEQPMRAICCSETTPNWSGESVTDSVTGVVTPGILTKTIHVYMEEGDNTIMLQGLYGYTSSQTYNSKPYSPLLDKMEVKYSDTQLGVVADAPDQQYIEMEDYDGTTGDAFVKDMGAFSGGKGVNLNKANGSFTYNVNVPTAGVYKLDISYAYLFERWLSVKVGDTQRINVQFNIGTDTWEGTGTNDPEDHPAFYMRSVLVWLEAGDNRITFSSFTTPGSSNTDSPSLDYFTLDLIECAEFVKPELEITVNPYSLIDIAKLTASEDIDVKKLADHNEYSGVTLEGKQSLTVTAELPYPFLITGYSYATKNNNDEWTVEASEDGTEWTALSPNGNSKEGIVYTYTMPKPYTENPQAVKYVRIVASGTEDVNLTEFLLFGNPYLSADQQFPEGIFKADQFEMTCNNEGYPSWNQLPEHLFTGDIDKLFAFKRGEEDVTVTVELLEDVKATSYMIATSELWHHPKDWEVWGADSETGEWVLLDERHDVSFLINGSTFFFPINEPKTCNAYKLIFKNTDGELSKWQMFTEENSPITGIQSTSNSNLPSISISANDGKLSLSSDKAANYNIYTIQGARIASGTINQGNTNVSLPAGIYLLKTANKTVKVAIK